jgi:hypothetical protein
MSDRTTTRPRGANGDARPDLGGALAGAGIHLRRLTPGEHRAPCPACAEAKRRSSDTALAVRIDADGSAVWVCFRCRWTGAVGSECRDDFRDQSHDAVLTKML